MALGQRRMIHTNLWKNTEFTRLSMEARLLYIATVTFADDDGRLKANSKLLRSDAFPLDDEVSAENIRLWLNEMVKVKLITYYKHDGEYYIEHPNWEKYQILRADRKKDSDIPPPIDNQLTTKRRRRLVKDSIREVRAYASVDWLRKIPEDVLEEWHQRFDCSKEAIKSKAEDLALWCETNSRMKKNYKTFLLVALKKDFPPRKAPPKPVEKEPEEVIDRESVKAMLRKTREAMQFAKPMGVGEAKTQDLGQ